MICVQNWSDENEAYHVCPSCFGKSTGGDPPEPRRAAPAHPVRGFVNPTLKVLLIAAAIEWTTIEDRPDVSLRRWNWTTVKPSSLVALTRRVGIE